MTDEEIGANIKAALKRAGMTQARLGELLGVNQGAVSKYLRGLIPVTATRLVVIADALGVTPADLLAGVSAPKRAATPTADLLERVARTIFRVAHPGTSWSTGLSEEGRAAWVAQAEPVLRDLTSYLTEHAEPFCRCPLPLAEQERLLSVAEGVVGGWCSRGLCCKPDGHLGECAICASEPPKPPAPRDPRVQQMIDDPETYFREARKKARAEAETAIKREKELAREVRERRYRSHGTGP